MGRGAFLGSTLQLSHWNKDLNKGKEGALENLEGEPSKKKAASIDTEKGMCMACLVEGEESCEKQYLIHSKPAMNIPCMDTFVRSPHLKIP